MTENEESGIELLLSDPEIVAWLELDEGEDDEGRRRRGAAPATGGA
jgi:hypothetical protein